MTSPSQSPGASGGRRSRRRRAGLVGTLVGAAAAGVAAGVAAERVLLKKRRRVTERDPYRDEPLGLMMADEYRTVITDEGLPLHVEIDGDPTAPLTVVFVHGFCLDLGTFHFQRRALKEVAGVRTVSFDQPGHGRSGRLEKGEYTLGMLGAALKNVIEQTTPQGRVVLVGHSMGGMAIMALADDFPELFKPDGRICGVALISTSAGELGGLTFGLPEMLVRFRKPLLPVISGAGWVTAGMLDRAREASTDLAWLLTRKYGFGTDKPSPALVSYVERMNSATRTESVARYLRTLYTHDRVMALGALTHLPVLVICGDEDLLTPVEHSEAICAALPGAELIVVPDAGHVVLLEHSEAVNAVVLPFVRRLETRHMKIELTTVDDTVSFGRRLASILRPGDLVVLDGPLGAGKTALVRGIGAGLGVRGAVTSPTFVIARVHRPDPGRGGRVPLVHVDAYRLGDLAEVDDLDLDASLDDSVTVVEWGGGKVEQLAEAHLLIRLERRDDDSRLAELAGAGGDWSQRLAALAAG